MTVHRPSAQQYDRSTALLVVDVQNDFADPAGSLYVSGGEQIPAIVNAEIAAAVDAGSLVVHTQDWHPTQTPHFERDGGVWPVHCVAGTWGAELHPELRVAGPRVQKGTGGEDGYSGFTIQDPRTGERHATGLEELLRERGIATVVIVGLATDYCVKETALDAVAKGFQTFVLRRGIRAVDLAQGDGDRAIRQMSHAGVQIEPAALPVLPRDRVLPEPAPGPA
ncbi:MAG: isochorismatase family protein [Actinomycetota bacterium]|nr:isochorismatase family protein [Actinomycetota bacterium]MDQ6947240.1 isochorismatase family protein [Actinomycetota bacterium]